MITIAMAIAAARTAIERDDLDGACEAGACGRASEAGEGGRGDALVGGPDARGTVVGDALADPAATFGNPRISSDLNS